MEWKEKYSVGIPEIDKEHQFLVSCVSEIEQAVAEGERGSMLHAAIGQLLHLTRTHFKLEETSMRIQHYPDIESHITGHQKFLADLKALEAKALTTALTQESVKFLPIWLEEHLLSDDKRYAASLSETEKQVAGRKYYP